MPGPVRHHLIETDIEHDTAEVEQQHVDGGGRWRQFMASFTKLAGSATAAVRRSAAVRDLARLSRRRELWLRPWSESGSVA
jgi:hypothetical protein